MLQYSRKQNGLSLLEALLALGIASGIITMSYLFYASYKRDADAMALVANVDALAQAASQYYYAQCYGTTDSVTTAVTPGTLTAGNFVDNLYVLNIYSDLQTTGYLKNTLRANSLIDNTASNGGYSVGGYTVAFYYQYSDRLSSGNSIGTISHWTIVIGAKLNNSDISNQIKSITQAQCTSTSYGNNVSVWPCSAVASNAAYCSTTPSTIADWVSHIIYGCAGYGTNAGYGDYIVFERQPTFGSSLQPNDLWLTNPVVSQFTSLYRNATGSSATNYSSQNFLCN